MYNKIFMKVFVAADHGGFQLKEELNGYLMQKEYEVEDVGAHRFDPNDDYPDFVFPAAERVVVTPGSLGIIIGRSGNGEAMAANKVKGVRAAVCVSVEMAKKARLDNDANVLSLGADYINTETVKNIVDAFLTTSFSGEERHKRRLEKISTHESSKA